MSIQVEILGSGTSQGIPVIGCKCVVCLSDNSYDNRLRTSALIRVKGVNFVIDTGPDFRQQMLRHHVDKVDAVLYTHEHNDHIIGLDEVRSYNFLHKMDMPLYGLPRVIDEVKRRFSYIFVPSSYPGVPKCVTYHCHPQTPFEINGVVVEPIEVMHGSLPILGYKIGNVAYLTDVKSLSEQTITTIEGVDLLIISALHHEEHHSHSTLKQTLGLIDIIKPKRAYLIHMSHYMGLHNTIQATLPSNVFLAYDGLKITT